MTRRRLGLGLGVLCAVLGAQRGQADPAAIAPWGIDLAGMDRSVAPGDDFVRFSGGAWLANTPIPPDRTSWGPFFELRARAEQDVKAIVDEVASRPHGPGSIEQKIADFYASYLDAAAIEQAGLAPVKADLAAIAAARSYDEIGRLMGRAELGVGGPLSLGPWPDAKHPERYAINIVQSGLGLPDRDYYLKDDRKLVEIRARYQAYIAAMLALGQCVGAGDADQVAAAVVALETAMARLHWTREKRGDRNLTYPPKTQAELMVFAPDFPWREVLSAAELSRQHSFVVKELDAVLGLTQLFRRTPVEIWRAYLAFHYLDHMADVIPAAFDNLAFDFHGRTLSGQQQPRARWKRATGALDRALGEAVGQIYVQRHFASAARAQITALVENLRAAFRTRIAQSTWMSNETRQAAQQKLATLRVKVGYPDTWRNYASLEVRAGDPVGNRKRALVWDWHRKVARLSAPTDRAEWGMTPQTVNAYYESSFNEIVFPAAILQPPYFDPGADPAVNYGGIGGVIGHEMGHAFDDQGSKSDGNGVLRPWWNSQDVARFKALAAGLVVQYARYEPLPGVHLDGATTLGENIGDNAGLRIALEAYRISLHGQAAPVLDGFSGEQRFFLSWAQTYRENVRGEQLRRDIASDPHSPAEFRVNGVVRNMDAWYAAFGVNPGARLYLAPNERIQIW